MPIAERQSPRESHRALLLSLLVVGVVGLAACGGDDDEDSATGAELSTRAELSQEQRIERIADKWAALFAADDSDESCKLMSQPACERLSCESVSGPVPDCAPPSATFRRSFADAKVREVAIEDTQAVQVRAVAWFSNGEAVELSAGRYEMPCYGSGCDDEAERDRLGAWLITRFDENAGDAASITEVGNVWAQLFAEDNSAACEYMYGQPLCEKFFGRVGEPPEVGRPSAFQESFANATIERVAVRDARPIETTDGTPVELHRAAAEFSNGAVVVFIEETDAHHALFGQLGAWFVIDVGGNAGRGFFR